MNCIQQWDSSTQLKTMCPKDGEMLVFFAFSRPRKDTTQIQRISLEFRLFATRIYWGLIALSSLDFIGDVDVFHFQIGYNRQRIRLLSVSAGGCRVCQDLVHFTERGWKYLRGIFEWHSIALRLLTVSIHCQRPQACRHSYTLRYHTVDR